MTIKIYDRQSLKDSVLFEQIMRLDLNNMEKIMQSSEIEHPIEKRKLGFNKPGTVIAGFDGSILAGYIEYGFDYNNSDNIYISSFQIDIKYRNTKLFGLLIQAAKLELQRKDFINIVTHVQKTNINAIKIFNKIGFALEEREDKPKSYILIARKDKIFNQSTNFTN